MNGPKVTIRGNCHECVHCRSISYTCQGDSGSDVDCMLVNKAIGDTTWDTPDWCPLLPQAVVQAVSNLKGAKA